MKDAQRLVQELLMMIVSPNAKRIDRVMATVSFVAISSLVWVSFKVMMKIFS